MELTLLTVPQCPNAPLLERRLAQALTGLPDVNLVRREIDDEQEAARYGMHGSPTLLIDGVDPFAPPQTPAGVSCRLYPCPGGPLEGAPPLSALRQALQDALHAGPSARPATLAPELLGRAGRGRLAPAKGGLRAVHQRVLAAFAHTGGSPADAELAAAAAPYGCNAGRILAELHAADFLRLDTAGRIRAAYPFSAIPTPHHVQIIGGPEVYAMCAIDALGIPAMLQRQVVITSTEPGTTTPITITLGPGDETGTWEPSGAAVFAGQATTGAPCDDPDPTTGCEETAAAAEVCCGYVNFFATAKAAGTWAAAHPHVRGQVLGQADAVRLGTTIFGPLLE